MRIKKLNVLFQSKRANEDRSFRPKLDVCVTIGLFMVGAGKAGSNDHPGLVRLPSLGPFHLCAVDPPFGIWTYVHVTEVIPRS